MKQNVIVLTGFFVGETTLEEWYTHLHETEAQLTAFPSQSEPGNDCKPVVFKQATTPHTWYGSFGN
jgi:hypothetical protein